MGENARVFRPAHHNDGTMDLLLINGNISRRSTLQIYAAVEHGNLFDLPLVEYRKVLAYRWTPKNQDRGYISIDGESFPFEPFQAEIHKGLATVIMKNRQLP